MTTNPYLARLADYFGLWAYEPTIWQAQWEVIQRMDLAAHMRAASFPPAPTARQEQVRGKNVAVIPIMGSLMKGQSSMGGTSTVAIRRDVRAAAADPKVDSILLAIDSPGGTVAGTADLAADVKAARKAKPVWAQVEDLGASAAYWIASQAGAVFANHPTAQVGSIGTVMQVMDASGTAEKTGIKYLTFSTGPLKAIGGGTPISDEQRGYLQALVEASQASFDAAVMSGRRLSAAGLEKVRSGAVFLAEEAQSLKLIDGIQPLDVTLREITKA